MGALTSGLPPIPNPSPEAAPDNPFQQPATAALAAAPPANANMPAPNHEQTVAALRHFRIIRGVLRKLLTNPDLGKSDIRSETIDAITTLVGDRVITAPTAVAQMSAFPDKPREQRQAIEKMYEAQIVAEISVLDHHKTTNAPVFPHFASEHLRHPRPGRDHLRVMEGMMATHYSGGKNGRR